MLTPICNKSVNVNVVLGQCYSGGFVDDLTKVGCVVATASTGSEYSWSCVDIPFDEFVYHWTCAINGANHLGTAIESANIDNNGFISMDEAFIFAKNNDRAKKEHPQYSSIPISLGEDLAFNNIPEAVDIFIKDNDSDTGKQPNISTDMSWISPSIWARNYDDGVETHQNPEYSANHTSAYVCVKIHNRGKDDYTGGKWLHTYWAKAATAFNDKVWLGQETYQGQYVTGGKLEPIQIPAIAAGDSTTLKLTWALPSMLANETDSERHYFCLKAKINGTVLDNTFVLGQPIPDIMGSNDQAQVNVSIITNQTVSKETKVYVRNTSSQTETYSLQLRPRTDADANLYNMARIQITMSAALFQSWIQGGMLSNKPISAYDTQKRTVTFNSPDTKLEGITLQGNALEEASLQIIYPPLAFPTGDYTFDLIQRREDDTVVGGETFISHSLLSAYQTHRLS